MTDLKFLENASLDDIVFKGRNKEYGAYELRTHYAKRMKTAMFIVALIPTGLILFSFATRNERMNDNKFVKIIPTKLVNIKTEDPVIPPPPVTPPPPEVEVPPASTEYTTAIKIVPEADVRPPVKEIVNVGTKDVVSENKKPIVVVEEPPKPEVKPVIERKTEPETKVIVDVAAKFKGDWGKFLQNKLEDIMYDVEVRTAQVVQVRFVVDVDGKVTNITALTGDDELRKIAVKAIQSSGEWIPAEIAGKPVKAYKTQPIRFVPNE